MNKIMLLLVVCTGFVATVPMSANALEPQVVSQNPHREANLLIAKYPRDQNYDRDQNRQRQFSVYYRNSNDRQWTLEGYHNNRRDAQRAAQRLERPYVQVSREVNRGMGRG